MFIFAQGHKSVVIGTHAGATLSDNISSIFGTTFLSSLIPISVVLDIETEGDADVDDTYLSDSFEEVHPEMQVNDDSEVPDVFSNHHHAEIAGDSSNKSILAGQCMPLIKSSLLILSFSVE